MTMRPYVLLSVAASIDGRIDDATPERLLLSNDADFDRVDEVRAGVDAILVGASTIRADNPRLLVRAEERRQKRVAEGQSKSPLKVTLTAGTDLDPDARFFTAGTDGKVVYTSSASREGLAEKLGGVVDVVAAGEGEVDFGTMLADLSGRGVKRLMVEGGGHIHTKFLESGFVDELHLVIAPFLVGHPDAPRFTYDSTSFVNSPMNPFRLEDVRRIGEVALLQYRRTAVSSDDH